VKGLATLRGSTKGPKGGLKETPGKFDEDRSPRLQVYRKMRDKQLLLVFLAVFSM
jgi:hypothetical protein